MSRKSRPPKAKGRKGKKAKAAAARAAVDSYGPPFGLIVLIAVVLSIPSLTQFVDGSMAFDSTVLRFMAALAVSWLLINLVYAVAHSFRKEAPEAPPPLDQGGFAADQNAEYRVGRPPGE